MAFVGEQQMSSRAKSQARSTTAASVPDGFSSLLHSPLVPAEQAFFLRRWTGVYKSPALEEDYCRSVLNSGVYATQWLLCLCLLLQRVCAFTWYPVSSHGAASLYLPRTLALLNALGLLAWLLAHAVLSYLQRPWPRVLSWTRIARIMDAQLVAAAFLEVSLPFSSDWHMCRSAGASAEVVCQVFAVGGLPVHMVLATAMAGLLLGFATVATRICILPTVAICTVCAVYLAVMRDHVGGNSAAEGRDLQRTGVRFAATVASILTVAWMTDVKRHANFVLVTTRELQLDALRASLRAQGELQQRLQTAREAELISSTGRSVQELLSSFLSHRMRNPCHILLAACEELDLQLQRMGARPGGAVAQTASQQAAARLQPPLSFGASAVAAPLGAAVAADGQASVQPAPQRVGEPAVLAYPQSALALLDTPDAAGQAAGVAYAAARTVTGSAALEKGAAPALIGARRTGGKYDVRAVAFSQESAPSDLRSAKALLAALDALKQLRSGVGQIARLVQKATAHHDLCSGHYTVQRKPVNVRRLMDEVSASLQRSAEAQNQLIVVSIADGVPDTCTTDPQMLRRILEIGVENAVAASGRCAPADGSPVIVEILVSAVFAPSIAAAQNGFDMRPFSSERDAAEEAANGGEAPATPAGEEAIGHPGSERSTFLIESDSWLRSVQRLTLHYTRRMLASAARYAPATSGSGLLFSPDVSNPLGLSTNARAEAAVAAAFAGSSVSPEQALRSPPRSLLGSDRGFNLELTTGIERVPSALMSRTRSQRPPAEARLSGETTHHSYDSFPPQVQLVYAPRTSVSGPPAASGSAAGATPPTSRAVPSTAVPQAAAPDAGLAGVQCWLQVEVRNIGQGLGGRTCRDLFMPFERGDLLGFRRSSAGEVTDPEAAGRAATAVTVTGAASPLDSGAGSPDVSPSQTSAGLPLHLRPPSSVPTPAMYDSRAVGSPAPAPSPALSPTSVSSLAPLTRLGSLGSTVASGVAGDGRALGRTLLPQQSGYGPGALYPSPRRGAGVHDGGVRVRESPGTATATAPLAVQPSCSHLTSPLSGFMHTASASPHATASFLRHMPRYDSLALSLRGSSMGPARALAQIGFDPTSPVGAAAGSPVAGAAGGVVYPTAMSSIGLGLPVALQLAMRLGARIGLVDATPSTVLKDGGPLSMASAMLSTCELDHPGGQMRLLPQSSGASAAADRPAPAPLVLTTFVIQLPLEALVAPRPSLLAWAGLSLEPADASPGAGGSTAARSDQRFPPASAAGFMLPLARPWDARPLAPPSSGGPLQPVLPTVGDNGARIQALAGPAPAPAGHHSRWQLPGAASRAASIEFVEGPANASVLRAAALQTSMHPMVAARVGIASSASLQLPSATGAPDRTAAAMVVSALSTDRSASSPAAASSVPSGHPVSSSASTSDVGKELSGESVSSGARHPWTTTGSSIVASILGRGHRTHSETSRVPPACDVSSVSDTSAGAAAMPQLRTVVALDPSGSLRPVIGADAPALSVHPSGGSLALHADASGSALLATSGASATAACEPSGAFPAPQRLDTRPSSGFGPSSRVDLRASARADSFPLPSPEGEKHDATPGAAALSWLPPLRPQCGLPVIAECSGLSSARESGSHSGRDQGACAATNSSATSDQRAAFNGEGERPVLLSVHSTASMSHSRGFAERAAPQGARTTGAPPADVPARTPPAANDSPAASPVVQARKLSVDRGQLPLTAAAIVSFGSHRLPATGRSSGSGAMRRSSGGSAPGTPAADVGSPVVTAPTVRLLAVQVLPAVGQAAAGSSVASSIAARAPHDYGTHAAVGSDTGGGLSPDVGAGPTNASSGPLHALHPLPSEGGTSKLPPSVLAFHSRATTEPSDRREGQVGEALASPAGVGPLAEAGTSNDSGFAAAADAHTAASALAPAATRRLRVLVVDDELSIQKVHVRYLQRLGHEAFAVGDGSAVLPTLQAAAAAEQPIDCVLLDIVMRDMHGPEACRQARAAGFTGPIIAATGNAAPRDVVGYMAAGFSGCLQKPFGLPELRDALAEAFEALEAAGLGLA